MCLLFSSPLNDAVPIVLLKTQPLCSDTTCSSLVAVFRNDCSYDTRTNTETKQTWPYRVLRPRGCRTIGLSNVLCVVPSRLLLGA